MCQVVVVTSKKKMRSNSLPFMFIPAGDRSLTSSIRLSNKDLSSFTAEHKMKPSSSTTLPNSPQPATSSNHSSSSDVTDVFTTLFPSSPTTDDLSSILDICIQSLDMKAEEKILSTAVLPANSLSMQGSTELFGLA